MFIPGVPGGEVFPHLVPVNAAALGYGRGSTSLEKGKLPGREFTAAACRAESELLLMVFEGSRALVLRIESAS